MASATGRHLMVVEGNRDGDGEPTFRTVAQLETVTVAVQLSQTLARVAEPDAGLHRSFTQPGSIVGNSQHQIAGAAHRTYVDAARRGTAGDSVPDGVLHNGLEQQTRHACAESRGLHFDIDGQSIAE